MAYAYHLASPALGFGKAGGFVEATAPPAARTQSLCPSPDETTGGYGWVIGPSWWQRPGLQNRRQRVRLSPDQPAPWDGAPPDVQAGTRHAG